MTKINFQSIEYLSFGNEKQKKSYKILSELEIFETLKNFTPILVGTIPLGVDNEKSDLDIVCYFTNILDFRKLIEENFSKQKNFSIREDLFKNNLLVANFFIDEMEIEIYGSHINSTQTNGYRHMIIEDRILQLADSKFRQKIIELKKDGMKTEPAFAFLLKLEGNPYDKILELENYSDYELIKLCAIKH